MALFFDAAWFDERLEQRGLSRAVLAAACGLSGADLALVFKDQRELSAAEVGLFAEVLGAPAAEVADRAGVSTPVPRTAGGLEARIAELEGRLARLEAEIAALKPV
jgi:hypothetical protein